MSNQKLRIGFIGGGNMARAIASGLLRAGHAPSAIAVSEPAAETRVLLEGLGGIRVVARNPEVAERADVLVLAVKPQVMPAVLEELAVVPGPAGQLVYSVAAGITLASIAAGLKKTGIPAVRVMPNQPALIGEGMSVLVASVEVSVAQKAQAVYVAEATGRALWIADEALMDAVTAVSGSGPAYFYLLMEMMEDSAVQLGLPRETARALVRQTAIGAARAAGMPDADLAALRASVTSPGGTTAAAVAVLEAAGVRAIFERAIAAARDRGAELGRGVR